MAKFLINKKPLSDVVTFYIPENTTDNKTTTRIFLKKDCFLYGVLLKALSDNAAEYATETGDEFLNKLKDETTKTQYHKMLSGTVGIKFDFNDIGLISSVVKNYLDFVSRDEVDRYVDEARPFSTKRYQSLYTPEATQQFLGSYNSMLAWYEGLNLPSAVSIDEKLNLFQLKSLGGILSNHEDLIQQTIEKLRAKYQEHPVVDNATQLNKN